MNHFVQIKRKKETKSGMMMRAAMTVNMTTPTLIPIVLALVRSSVTLILEFLNADSSEMFTFMSCLMSFTIWLIVRWSSTITQSHRQLGTLIGWIAVLGFVVGDVVVKAVGCVVVAAGCVVEVVV